MAIMRSPYIYVSVKNSSKKVKKRRINWKELIFHLHRLDINEAYDYFRKHHLHWSINRCAYNVLKTYYSTTTMRIWKQFFEDSLVSHYDYERTIRCGDYLLGLSEVAYGV